MILGLPLENSWPLTSDDGVIEDNKHNENAVEDGEGDEEFVERIFHFPVVIEFEFTTKQIKTRHHLLKQ